MKQCMWINPSQDPAEHGGYVPSLVKEGEPGHSPMLGQGKHAAPWVWGKTLEEAERTCKAYNAQKGISEDEALRIVGSSMFAGR